MKILGIEMSNYKKIKALNLDLEGKSFCVAGEPDTGKTTVISALWDLITPIADPLMHGEKKGNIRVEIGEPGEEYRIFAERKFTEKTNSISITTDKGRKLTAGTIKDLVNKITYEPLKLLEMKGKDLTRYLLSCAKLPDGFSIARLDSKRETLAEERLEAFRTYDILKKRLGDEPEKTEAIYIEPIKKELSGISEYNSKRERAIIKLESLADNQHDIDAKGFQMSEEIERHKKEIERLKFELEGNRGQLIDIKTQIEVGNKFVKDNPEKDANELNKKLDVAIESNQKAAKREAWDNDFKTTEGAERAYKTLDTKIKKIDIEKKTGLDNAEFPLEGLSVSDGKAYYKGHLLENCGTEKQIYVSTALIASRADGIKAMRIDRAESMGKKVRALVIKTAEKFGVQVCMSRVAEESIDENEITIVDGEYGLDGKDESDYVGE